ncbi:MAG TPA: hypothetical protein DEA38_10400, partial [Stenotrophomonas sp.]|nr:hypothetical protein [Stenotrophomonas sp.]
ALPAVRVSLDPNALNHAGLALEDVAEVISRANAVRPLGAVGDERQQWQLEAPLQLRQAAQYRELALKVSDDRTLRLGDVAVVADGVEDRYASG